MDASFLLYLAPTSTLAVKYTNNSRAFVHVPDFEQAENCSLLNESPLNVMEHSFVENEDFK